MLLQWKVSLRLFFLEHNAPNSKKLMDDYLFSGIPFMVVLDKEGNIIEKNLRGETLTRKLKQIFGF